MKISNYSINKNPYMLKDVTDVHYTHRRYYYTLKSNRKDLDKKYIIFDEKNDEIQLTDDPNLVTIFDYRKVSFEDSLDNKIKKFGKAKWQKNDIDYEYSRNIYKNKY